MKDDVFLTIFTPAYNRSDTLPALYESLRRQKEQNFEWLIVDDGSTDDTETIVKSWQAKEKKFPIRYYKTRNGGKHRAINKGVMLAKGKMFFIVDSDDFLADFAVANIMKGETELPKNRRYAGLGKNKIHIDGRAVGTSFNEDFIDASSLDRKKYNISGDKAEIFYTDILKSFPFPEFEGEKFMEEAYVWNNIAEAGYLLRWDNDPIYLCEYLDDGLTKSGSSKYKSSPKGYSLYLKQLVKHSPCLFSRMTLYSLYSKNVYGYDDLRKSAKEMSVSTVLMFLSVLLRKVMKK